MDEMRLTCERCEIAAATIYCITDAANICAACDKQMHTLNVLTLRHIRVPLCELCNVEQAAVYCEADMASLCNKCDKQMHSDVIAQRHARRPIRPENLVTKETPTKVETLDCLRPILAESFISQPRQTGLAFAPKKPSIEVDVDTLERKSDLLTSSLDSNMPASEKSDIDVSYAKRIAASLFALQKLEAWNYTEINTIGVPSLSGKTETGLATLVTPTANGVLDDQLQIRQEQLPMDTSGMSLNGPQDGPRAASQSSASNSFEVPSDVLYVGASQPLCREARLLRYKEKRKNRKFEKTVRYAARAAYAESRPRVKGRFAKRENESEDSPVEPPNVGEGLFGVDNRTQSSSLHPSGLQHLTSQVSTHQVSQAIPSSHGNDIFGSLLNTHPLVHTAGFAFPADSEIGTTGPALNPQLQSLLQGASLCPPPPSQQ